MQSATGWSEDMVGHYWDLGANINASRTILWSNFPSEAPSWIRRWVWLVTYSSTEVFIFTVAGLAMLWITVAEWRSTCAYDSKVHSLNVVLPLFLHCWAGDFADWMFSAEMLEPSAAVDWSCFCCDSHGPNLSAPGFDTGWTSHLKMTTMESQSSNLHVNTLSLMMCTQELSFDFLFAVGSTKTVPLPSSKSLDVGSIPHTYAT